MQGLYIAHGLTMGVYIYTACSEHFAKAKHYRLHNYVIKSKNSKKLSSMNIQQHLSSIYSCYIFLHAQGHPLSQCHYILSSSLPPLPITLVFYPFMIRFLQASLIHIFTTHSHSPTHFICILFTLYIQLFSLIFSTAVCTLLFSPAPHSHDFCICFKFALDPSSSIILPFEFPPVTSSQCDNLCSNSGTCGSNGTCVCVAGFTGPSCNTGKHGFITCTSYYIPVPQHYKCHLLSDYDLYICSLISLSERGTSSSAHYECPIHCRVCAARHSFFMIHCFILGTSNLQLPVHQAV